MRPAPEQRDLPSFTPAPRPPRALSSGRFDATATLRVLINWAYKPEFPIEGSFRELDEIFVIAATAARPVLLARPGEVGPMNQRVQSLLAERFKLRVRWETRSFPVFALRRTTTEQLGRNLKRIHSTCPPGYPETATAAPDGCFVKIAMDRGQVKGLVLSIPDFAKFLSNFVARHVVDDTGLAGAFELNTAFNPRSLVDSGPPAENLPSLADALRSDLGLKLESERRDFPVLIVEHVEGPTEN